MAELRKTPVTIANGQTVGAQAVDVGSGRVAAIGFPNGWTAADLQFLASLDGGATFAPVYGDDGTRVKILSASLPAGEARIIVNKALLEQLAGVPLLKLESSAAQGADRSIVVFVKG